MLQADQSYTTYPSPSLATLVRRYWDEVDAEPNLDDEGNVNASAQATMSRMMGVPARSSEDALAALDFLLAEGVDLGREHDPIHLTEVDGLSEITTSLVHAIRD
jgi:hypothetical protein